jgi:hypothetical protein
MERSSHREAGAVKLLAIAGFWLEAGNSPHMDKASSG